MASSRLYRQLTHLFSEVHLSDYSLKNVLADVFDLILSMPPYSCSLHCHSLIL